MKCWRAALRSWSWWCEVIAVDVLEPEPAACSVSGHLVFVVTPERIKGAGIVVRSRDLLSRRAELGLWPVGNNANRVRKFAPGEPILFYAGGAGDPDRSAFISAGEVAGVMVEGACGRIPAPEAQRVVRAWVAGVFELPIRNVRFFARPVPVAPLVPNLEFFSNKDRWSARLAGAFHRMNGRDVAHILEAAGEPVVGA